MSDKRKEFEEEIGPEALRRAGMRIGSGEPENVLEVRTHIALTIKCLINSRDEADSDHQSTYDVAIQHLETAGMYAVKALYLSMEEDARDE